MIGNLFQDYPLSYYKPKQIEIMGYTHSWRSTEHTHVKQWNGFVDEVKKLYKALPKKTATAGGFHKNDPLIVDGQNGRKPFLGEYYVHERENLGECVFFNGGNDPNDPQSDLGHETFAIFKKKIFEGDFCKTNRKPYDLFVCVCLLAAAKHLHYKIHSDGNLPDWKQAFNLYARVTGKKFTAEEKRSILNKK